jgi:porin
MLDQWLLDQSDSSPGLSVFLRSYGAPRSERAIASWYVDFGFKLTRPIPGRDHDVLSAGFAILDFGNQYLASELAKGNVLSPRESVLELTYLLQVTGWMTLQPNLQFFFDPHYSRRDAVAFGVRATVDL